MSTVNASSPNSAVTHNPFNLHSFAASNLPASYKITGKPIKEVVVIKAFDSPKFQVKKSYAIFPKPRLSRSNPSTSRSTKFIHYSPKPHVKVNDSPRPLKLVPKLKNPYRDSISNKTTKVSKVSRSLPKGRKRNDHKLEVRENKKLGRETSRKRRVVRYKKLIESEWIKNDKTEACNKKDRGLKKNVFKASLSFEGNCGLQKKVKRIKKTADSRLVRDEDSKKIKTVTKNLLKPAVSLQKLLYKKTLRIRNKEKAVRCLAGICRKILEKRYFTKLAARFKENHKQSQIKEFAAEDLEVQNIMCKKHEHKVKSPEKPQLDVSSMNLVKSQQDFKFLSKNIISELKSKELSEMQELIKFISCEKEIKEKLTKLIDKRYSSLEHLFLTDTQHFPSACNEVPNLSVKISVNNSCSKPEAVNADSRIELSELFELKEGFSKTKGCVDGENNLKCVDHVMAHSEFPVLSQLINPRKILSETDKTELTIGTESQAKVGVKESKICMENGHEKLILKPLKSNHIYITDDSFSSIESGVNQEHSEFLMTPIAESESLAEDIVCEKLEATENLNLNLLHRTKSQAHKPAKIIFEKAPKSSEHSFNLLDSNENNGNLLVISSVISTIEIDLLNHFIETYISNPNIPVQSHQVKSLNILNLKKNPRSNPVEKSVRKLQFLNNPMDTLESIKKSLHPLMLLSTTQTELLPFYLSSDSQQTYFSSSSKYIEDSFNEAIISKAAKKIHMPWNLQPEFTKANYESFIKTSASNVIKWSELEVGKIPTADMLNCFMEIDEQKLEAVRQDKLMRLLMADLAGESWGQSELQVKLIVFEQVEGILGGLYDEILRILDNSM